MKSTQPVMDARDGEFEYLARFRHTQAARHAMADEERKVVIQVPKCLRIKDDIAEAVENGTYARRSRLPGETEYAQRYGVTRMTARGAFDGARCRRPRIAAQRTRDLRPRQGHAVPTALTQRSGSALAVLGAGSRQPAR